MSRSEADCYMGNPAPRGVDFVFHHDLEKFEGGERCMECGTVFLTRAAKAKAKLHIKALRELGLEVMVYDSKN